jgi:multiple sugar transport system substrate-binding protein
MMRKTSLLRRVPIALAAAALAVIPLAACGSDDPGTSDPSDTGTGSVEQVTLRFTWWGDDGRAAITQSAIERFMADNPGIVIEGEPKVMDGYFDSLATQISAQDAPDIMTLGGSYPLDYAKNSAITNLQTLTDIDLAPFSANILSNSTYEGGVYGVPTGANTLAILANPDIFEQAGIELPDDDAWTWEEFAEIATQITANTPDGIYGAELRFEDINGTYAAQRGESLYSTDGKSVAVPATTLADYWTMSLGLLKSGGTAPAELQEEVKAAGPEETLLGQGKAAMITGYDNQLEAYSTASGAPVVLLRIPGESQYKQAGCVLNPSQYYAIWSGTKHPAEAAKFVNFLVNDPAVGPIIGANRGMPSNPDVRAAAEVGFNDYQKADSAYLDRVQEHIAGTYVPQPAGAQIQNDLSRELDGKVLFEQLTPQEAGEQWISRMQGSIDEANK